MRDGGISQYKNKGASPIALSMPARPGEKGASPFISDKRILQEFAMFNKAGSLEELINSTRRSSVAPALSPFVYLQIAYGIIVTG